MGEFKGKKKTQEGAYKKGKMRYPKVKVASKKPGENPEKIKGNWGAKRSWSPDKKKKKKL